MEKKMYSKPEVVQHESITFETGLSSCIKIASVDNSHPLEKVCLKPDHHWYDI